MMNLSHDVLQALIDDFDYRRELLCDLIAKVQGQLRVEPMYDGNKHFRFALNTQHEMKRSLYVLERVLGPPTEEFPVGLTANITQWVMNTHAGMSQYVRLVRFPDHGEVIVTDAVAGYYFSTAGREEQEMLTATAQIAAREIGQTLDDQIMRRIIEDDS